MLTIHINKFSILKFLNNIYLSNYKDLDIEKMFLVYRQPNANGFELKL